MWRGWVACFPLTQAVCVEWSGVWLETHLWLQTCLCLSWSHEEPRVCVCAAVLMMCSFPVGVCLWHNCRNPSQNLPHSHKATSSSHCITAHYGFYDLALQWHRFLQENRFCSGSLLCSFARLLCDFSECWSRCRVILLTLCLLSAGMNMVSDHRSADMWFVLNQSRITCDYNQT